MLNLGSFGQGQPGQPQDALAQAIAARSQGTQPVPALNQTMQGSPQPGQVPSAPAGGMPTPQTKTPVTEAEIILKALDSRLKTISKIEEANLAPQNPQAMG
jgi:hypothetical protein